MLNRGESGDEGGVNIEDADILVGAGRGFGGPDNLGVAEELAESLGGAVASTRAIVFACTPSRRLTTRSTVASETPAVRATSSSVGACLLMPAP